MSNYFDIWRFPIFSELARTLGAERIFQDEYVIVTPAKGAWPRITVRAVVCRLVYSVRTHSCVRLSSNTQKHPYAISRRNLALGKEEISQ